MSEADRDARNNGKMTGKPGTRTGAKTGATGKPKPAGPKSTKPKFAKPRFAKPGPAKAAGKPPAKAGAAANPGAGEAKAAKKKPTLPPVTAKPEDFSGGEIETGRLLFARPWTFRIGVPSLTLVPPMQGIEIAMAGRSNVGKSSLINALVGQKALARTSNTPGRTQELNYFRPEGEGTDIALVDMPGYGYAAAPKDKVDAWTELVFGYLRGRQNLKRVYLLIDSRHGPKDNDLEVMGLLDKAAVSYQVVMTKADKVGPKGLEAAISATHEAIARRAAAYPRIVVTSSEKNEGIDILRAEIVRLVAGN